ncbi:MAG: class I SAM-dependent methyltransferase [Acidobacteriota bacterium]
MAEGPSRWHGWHNAEIYAGYVRDFPLYRQLNARLARLADLATARRVLDLACGTGATAQACLRHLPWNGEVVGVDVSEEMVGVARTEVDDPRASFRVARASRIEEVVRGPFDRAVCNTAFWQFPDPGLVLGVLGRLLSPGALLVWNVPVERMVGEPARAHPFQVALARAIEARAGSFTSSPPVLTGATLEAWIEGAGFDLVDTERYVYSARQEELVELMRIPAMIGSVALDLSPEERQGVIDLAAEWIDGDERVEVPWLYYVARRR